jgi:hypothetical protein
MAEYVTSALFVYTDDTKHLIKQLQNNSSGTRITSVAFETLTQTPQEHLDGVGHVVVAGPLDVIKEILRLAMKYHFSIGIIPNNRCRRARIAPGRPGHRSDSMQWGDHAV